MAHLPDRGLIRLIGFVPIVMLIIAVFELPYGYYALLRLVVTAAALLFLWQEIAKGVNGRYLWMISMGLIALLFNPLFPVHLTREIWLFIDLGVAGVFAAYVFLYPSGSAK